MAFSLARGTRAESVEASEKSCCFQSHMAAFMALFDLSSDSFLASKSSMRLSWFMDRTLRTTKDAMRHTFITELLLAALVAAATILLANSIMGNFECFGGLCLYLKRGKGEKKGPKGRM
uniref:Uncharacterized protein MANES_18G076600 n=1 Tax=Rhizophora mucronata TaxID=61149 RepID=A0A2P2J9X6_RHIMU